MKSLFVSSRSCTVLLDAEGDYYAKAPRRLFLNGEELEKEENRSVFSLYGLWPDTEYTLEAWQGDEKESELTFRTEKEFCALNVKRFGAQGNGEKDDTNAIQAAILACPPAGRVLIPEGNYKTGPLFLKSHITIEFKPGARLALKTDRTEFPVLPGMTRTTDEEGEYLLGSWEGNPLDAFASAITGIGVEDVRIIGEGIIDGCAPDGDWWLNPKIKRIAYRPRLFYLKDCKDITMQGVTFRNSPAWNLHPTFSENLSILNVRIEAPAVSPNTDGFDPESCKHIRMLGTVFSVGDDCIALKAGKIYTGMRYHTPCEDIEIAYCCMLDGHGGVTVGSEMAGGVKHVRVHHCYMRGNDRGLRIKTRRGRGKYAVIDDICFSDVRMEGVKTPLVVNAMYFCDPDGHSDYVQSREKQPVDDTTPTVGSIRFERVNAQGCEACVGYILGLPERPVKEILLKDSVFTFNPDGKAMVPAMASGVEECKRRGVIAHFVDSLSLTNVRMEGVEGEEIECHFCARLEK